MAQTSGSITLDTSGLSAGVTKTLIPVFEQLDQQLTDIREALSRLAGSLADTLLTALPDPLAGAQTIDTLKGIGLDAHQAQWLAARLAESGLHLSRTVGQGDLPAQRGLDETFAGGTPLAEVAMGEFERHERQARSADTSWFDRETD